MMKIINAGDRVMNTWIYETRRDVWGGCSPYNGYIVIRCNR